LAGHVNKYQLACWIGIQIEIVDIVKTNGTDGDF